MITLVLEGLCAFVQHEGNWQVWMAEGHHELHRPTLSASSLGVDKESSTWMPDFIGFIEGGFAIFDGFFRGWNLMERTIEVGEGTAETSWAEDPSRSLINLGAVHKGHRATIGSTRCGRVIFKGGELSATAPRKRVLSQQGKPMGRGPVESASRVLWRGEGRILDRGTGKVIVLKDNPNNVVTVVNASGSAGGDSHFHNYYDLLPTVPHDEALHIRTLIDDTLIPHSPHGEVHLMNVTTGENCVPSALICD